MRIYIKKGYWKSKIFKLEKDIAVNYKTYFIKQTYFNVNFVKSIFIWCDNYPIDYTLQRLPRQLYDKHSSLFPFIPFSVFVKTKRRFNVDLDLAGLLNSEEDGYLTFYVQLHHANVCRV